MIRSTCNRTEVYALSLEKGKGSHSLFGLFEYVQGVKRQELDGSTYYLSGQEAVEQLFLVTSGLDSMVLGETQILGQVREAYEKAVKGGAVGKIFHALFQQALYSARRVQSETGINGKSASISYAAVNLAKKKLGSLFGRRVLVIGAGEMSRLTLKHLSAMGVKDICVTSRTRERSEALALDFDSKAPDFQDREKSLVEADIVIASTGAPHIVVKEKEVRKAMESRSQTPLFFIDIAVLRDIDPGVKEIRNVFLYDIDDLQEVVSANMEERENDAIYARKIICEQVKEFEVWHKNRMVVPVIKALRQKADAIRRTEVENYFSKKLGGLNTKEKTAVETLTRAIINNILKEPILRLKTAALEDHCDPYVYILYHLFALQGIEENLDGLLDPVFGRDLP